MTAKYAELKVKPNFRDNNFVVLKFRIDPKVSVSLVPENDLNKIGVESYKTVKHKLANGKLADHLVGDAYFEYKGEGAPSQVIFAKKGNEPVIGAKTLEAMGLTLDTSKMELVQAS